MDPLSDQTQYALTQEQADRFIHTPIRIRQITVDGVQRTKMNTISQHYLVPLAHASTANELQDFTKNMMQELKETGAFSNVQVVHEVSPHTHNEMMVSTDSDSTTTTTTDALVIDTTIKVKERKMLGSSRVLLQTDEGSNVQAGATHTIINPTGRLDKLAFSVASGHKSNYLFNSAWTIPHFLSSPFTSQFSLFRSTDSMVDLSSYELLSSGGSFSLTTPSRSHSLLYNLAWRDVIPQTQPLGDIPNSVIGPSHSVMSSAVPSILSALSYTFNKSSLDNPLVPTRGAYLHSSLTYAGLGGDVNFVKGEVKSRAVLPLTKWLSLHLSGRVGALRMLNESSSHLPDRFHLGGSLNVRSFETGGIGPRDRNDMIGGDVYAAGKAAVEVGLPGTFLDDLGARFQVFGTAGNLTSMSDFNKDTFISTMRSSCGVGLAVPTPFGARLEVNYTKPIREYASDKRIESVFQFGLSADWL